MGIIFAAIMVETRQGKKTLVAAGQVCNFVL
jgi:hypothetical protein